MKKLLCLTFVMLLALSACAMAEEAAVPTPLAFVDVYVPDANFDQLEAKQVEGEATPEGLIEALVEAGAIPEGTTVLAYDGIVLDLSKEFGEAMTHTGTAGEYLMMGAVVNTFVTNFGLEELTVTSDGKTIETGHAVYDEPLSFYESNKG